MNRPRRQEPAEGLAVPRCDLRAARTARLDRRRVQAALDGRFLHIVRRRRGLQVRGPGRDGDGRREGASARGGATVHSTLARLAAKAKVVAEAICHARRPSAFARCRSRPARLGDRRLARPARPAPPAELEGVLAHELAHVRRRDVVTQEAAVWIASALVELTRIGGFLQRALMFVIGPLAAALVHLLLRRVVSSRPTVSRPSSAGRRTDSPMRCFGSSRRTS